MNGILLIDKPSGWTSSDVVAKLRGILQERRVGHSGTLDPMATGLLVVFVGRATRAVAFAESHSKRYRACLRLGISTDTQDTSGRVLAERPPASQAALEAVLPRFLGEQSQIPPMYSAIKIQGRKLCDIARRGGEVERPPRKINISALRLVGREGEDYVLDVSCSKGTYIRTLCADIGAALGCGGCMSALRRTRAGDFLLENASSLDAVQRAADRGEAERLLLPVDSLFMDSPAHRISPAAEKKLRCGNPLPSGLGEGAYRVYSQSGEFLALCRAENGRLITIKSFFEV